MLSGESRFGELEVPFNEQLILEGTEVRLSKAYASPSVQYNEMAAGAEFTWHPALARQIVTILSGVLEVETSDNQTRRWSAGEQFFPDDLTGKGHVARAIGGPVQVFVVKVPEGLD